MKKYYTMILLLSLAVNQSIAQSTAPVESTAPAESTSSKFKATLLSGYTFATDLPTSAGGAKIEGGYTFGVEMGFQASQVLQIDLSYQDQLSETNISYTDNTNRLVVDNNIPTSTQYILLGASYNWRKTPEQKFVGFGGFGLGVSIIKDRSDYYDTHYLFGIAAKLGFNYFFNEKIGIQIKGQLGMPIQGVGGSLYVGTGGAGVGLSAYSAAFQFAPMGGFVINLGGNK